ncbi:Ig-like domain-containing protein [Desulfosporosinus sp. PR]|uniref:fibronectin type III domain-containing protein n=1 Tax=Candidatus Desulfosporosinus nitrosoreducens TaxID=3401928 RepID=UPI0027EE4C46|nr:Ig-like domain-containing protein [Desulfosporosinus sp. PR]MDQ7092112.1 Ig-like domain-containing protein [Desulfosporosinus sp. PR]
MKKKFLILVFALILTLFNVLPVYASSLVYYDSLDSNFSYLGGTWSKSVNTSDYGGSVYTSPSLTAHIDFNFSGTSLNIIGRGGSFFSNIITVYIDGSSVGTFSEMSGPFQKLCFTLTGLSNTVHSCSIVNSSDGVLNLDAVQIDSGCFLYPYSFASLPSVPSGLQLIQNGTSCTLAWAANPSLDDVVSYNVYLDGSYYADSSTNSYTCSNLPAGSHSFAVSAVNAAGESSQSAPISYTVLDVPGQVTATPGNAQVTLSWNSVNGATGYNIGRATTSGGNYTTIASNVSDTAYTDTNLTNGTTYYYVVSATSASGGSDNSAEVSTTPQASEISSPSKLLATSGDGQVNLTWTGVSGANSYNVKRSTTSGGVYATIATGLTSSNYTDTSVINGTTYYYVVTAVSESGESGNSNEATATPQVSAPSSPTNLEATTTTGSGTSLTWTAVTGATGYNVKRSATAGGPYTSIAQNVSGTNYTDTSVTAGATYYYVVTAITSGGESANSNEASATVPAPTDDRLYVLLDINEQAQLSVSDNLSDNATLTWTSSDPTVAIVDANGEVTAIKEGECKITANNSDGTFTDYIPVKVMKGAENFRLALNLKAGESKRLWISDDSSSVSWTTMDSAVATIDNTGKVTAVANGLCIVQGEFNGKTYYIYVRVN